MKTILESHVPFRPSSVEDLRQGLASLPQSKNEDDAPKLPDISEAVRKLRAPAFEPSVPRASHSRPHIPAYLPPFPAAHTYSSSAPDPAASLGQTPTTQGHAALEELANGRATMSALNQRLLEQVHPESANEPPMAPSPPLPSPRSSAGAEAAPAGSAAPRSNPFLQTAPLAVIDRSSSRHRFSQHHRPTKRARTNESGTMVPLAERALAAAQDGESSAAGDGGAPLPGAGRAGRLPQPSDPLRNTAGGGVSGLDDAGWSELQEPQPTPGDERTERGGTTSLLSSAQPPQ